MSEFADLLIDQMWDQMLEEDFDEEGPFPDTKTCRHCGALGLKWGQNQGKWRLFNGKGVLHSCYKTTKVRNG